jgi:hypothetical protein
MEMTINKSKFRIPYSAPRILINLSSSDANVWMFSQLLGFNRIDDVLSRTFERVFVPYHACKEALLGMGFPEWQTDGTLDPFHLVDEESPITKEGVDMDDYSKITGEQPMALEQWVEQNKAGFT